MAKESARAGVSSKGSRPYTGYGPPRPELGKAQDLYFQEPPVNPAEGQSTTGAVWRKDPGGWVVLGRFMARMGYQIRSGAEGPEIAFRQADGSQGPWVSLMGQIPAHYWLGTSLAWELPDGERGEYVDLQGPPGEDGLDGTDGEDGADGLNADLRVSGTSLQKRLGDGAWSDLFSLTTLKGTDGRQVELQATATHIQWRLAGDASWTNLVALATLKGAPGTDATAPTLSLGSVTVLAAGSTPTVTLTGTASARVLNFGVAAGAAGTSFALGAPVVVSPAPAHGTGFRPNASRPCYLAVTARLAGLAAVAGEVTLQVSADAAFTAPVTVGPESLTLTLAVLSNARTLNAFVPAGYYVRTQSTGLVLAAVTLSAVRWDL